MQVAKAVNDRAGCQAMVTSKRSLENYLHPAAIEEALGLKIAFSDTDSVAEVTVRAYLGEDCSWESLSARAQRRLRNRIMKGENTLAVEGMTFAHLAGQDPEREMASWPRPMIR